MRTLIRFRFYSSKSSFALFILVSLSSKFRKNKVVESSFQDSSFLETTSTSLISQLHDCIANRVLYFQSVPSSSSSSSSSFISTSIIGHGNDDAGGNSLLLYKSFDNEFENERSFNRAVASEPRRSVDPISSSSSSSSTSFIETSLDLSNAVFAANRIVSRENTSGVAFEPSVHRTVESGSFSTGINDEIDGALRLVRRCLWALNKFRKNATVSIAYRTVRRSSLRWIFRRTLFIWQGNWGKMVHKLTLCDTIWSRKALRTSFKHWRFRSISFYNNIAVSTRNLAQTHLLNSKMRAWKRLFHLHRCEITVANRFRHSRSFFAFDAWKSGMHHLRQIQNFLEESKRRRLEPLFIIWKWKVGFSFSFYIFLL